MFHVWIYRLYVDMNVLAQIIMLYLSDAFCFVVGFLFRVNQPTCVDVCAIIKTFYLNVTIMFF